MYLTIIGTLMSFLRLKSLFTKFWPYLLILCLTAVYFYFLLIDSRYFFYDDFTAFTFVVPRTYTRIIADSLASRDIDRHKIIGYLLTKFLYHTVSTRVEMYFAALFIIHSLNSNLLFSLLRRLTRHTLTSFVLSAVFAWRFYLWWFSNIHTLLAALFSLCVVHLWLNFLSSRRFLPLALIWLISPLMIYSYGSSFFVFPALFFLTASIYGFRNARQYLLYLSPFILLLIVYFFVYTRAPDSLTRFSMPENPYFRPISVSTFLNVQAQFLHALNPLLPVSIPLLGLVAGALLILTAAAAGHSFWLLAAYLTSIAPNSFFPNHTMFYYLYYPIIFLLVFIARLMRTRYWPVALISVIVLLNPVVNLSQIAFRLRHPAPNFEIKSIHLIDQAVTQAVKSGQTRIKLSNWEVTPNLNHAIDNQALPLFLSGPQKDRFHYSYSRDTQILTLTPRP